MKIETSKVYKKIGSTLTLHFTNDEGKAINRYQAEKLATESQLANMEAFYVVKNIHDLLFSHKKCDFKARLQANHDWKLLDSDTAPVHLLTMKQVFDEKQTGVIL